MSKIAVAYLMDFEGNQDDIKDQLDRCRKIAREQDMKIVDIYIDDDSFSKREKMILHSESKNSNM